MNLLYHSNVYLYFTLINQIKITRNYCNIHDNSVFFRSIHMCLDSKNGTKKGAFKSSPNTLNRKCPIFTFFDKN